MEVIVVKRVYNCYEESYSKILGVCISEQTANELIEKDKHRFDTPTFKLEEYYRITDQGDEALLKFKENEERAPKVGGFLNRIKYEQLTKQAKQSYDIVKESIIGDEAYDFWYTRIRYNHDIYINWIIVLLNTRYTPDELNKMKEIYNSINDNSKYEYAEDTYYAKETYEVIY